MSYQPEFKGPIEGYVVNFLHAQHWKIARTMPWADAMQVAYVVFLRCKQRFPKSKAYDTPQAFMALYKRCWFNEFTDMANEDTKRRAEVSFDVHRTESDSPTDVVPRELIGDTENDGVLSVMLNQAPREVQMVISLFLNAPVEMLELAFTAWKARHRGIPAGSNEHIAQLLGIDPSIDVMKMTEDYFTN